MDLALAVVHRGGDPEPDYSVLEGLVVQSNRAYESEPDPIPPLRFRVLK